MARRKEDRTRRKPTGVRRLKMSLDSATQERLEQEGKVARFFNDVDTRLLDAREGGYEYVMSNRTPIKVGEDEDQQGDNQPIRKFVGKNPDGSPQYAYLMAIKEDWYKEDQAEKEEVNKEVDRAIRGGSLESDHGVKPEHGSARVTGVQYQP